VPTLPSVLRIVTTHPHEHTIVVFGRQVALRKGDDGKIAGEVTEQEFAKLQGMFDAPGSAYSLDGKMTPTAITKALDAAAAPAPPDTAQAAAEVARDAQATGLLASAAAAQTSTPAAPTKEG
jgi:hypothetical protein